MHVLPHLYSRGYALSYNYRQKTALSLLPNVTTSIKTIIRCKAGILKDFYSAGKLPVVLRKYADGFHISPQVMRLQ
jgi:hypothetical protein